MSIPFSPAHADSRSEADRTTSIEEEAELEAVAGGDGAPIIVPDEPSESQDVGGPGGLIGEGSSVDQIRDILFGREMGAYEERFSLLEQRVQDASEALRSEMLERLDSLQAALQADVAGLGHRITQERDVRSVAIDELVKSVRQHRDALGKRIDRQEKAATDGAEALRAQMLSDSERAQEAFEARSYDLKKMLDESVSALWNQKTDRQTLAALLADMADRLSEGDSDADG